jgi:DNA polymerase-3 subunit delta'
MRDSFTINAVLGQEKAKTMLRRAAGGQRLAHAYLFRGPSGVGKKSLARAFGNYLNCLEPLPEQDACGHCPACRKLRSGNHPDRLLIEPDGAAIKIAQIRELKHALTFPPLEARLRIVLICEVHTMRREAANSLLKLLEEPPPGNLLILTGDGASEILPTITSRCQQIPLSPLPLDQVARELVAEGLEPETAATLAALGGGSLGQARQLAKLELMELRRTAVITLLDLRPGQAHTAEAIFALAESAAGLGELLPQFLGMLKLWFRDLLLSHHHQPGRIVNLDLREALARGQMRWPLPELPARFRLFDQAERQLARNCNRALVCEVLYFGLL